MADQQAANSTEEGSAKVSTAAIVMAVVGSVVVSAAIVGGVFYMLLSRGKLVLPVHAAAADNKPVSKPAATAKTHVLLLEPMIVNLADPSATAFVKVGVALRIADDPAAKAKEDKPQPGADAPVRDVLLDVVGRQQSAALIVPDGKEQLKQMLLKALQTRDAELHAQDIYFTEFLVQR